MPADPARQELTGVLDALSKYLPTTPVAVFVPATGRVHRCPDLTHRGRCDCADFFIPDAKVLAARINAGELGPMPPGYGPVILAYGIPWSSR